MDVTGREGLLLIVGLLLESAGESFPLRRGTFKVLVSLFVDGDFARLADSTNQCFRLASWFIKACLCFLDFRPFTPLRP